MKFPFQCHILVVLLFLRFGAAFATNRIQTATTKGALTGFRKNVGDQSNKLLKLKRRSVSALPGLFSVNAGETAAIAIGSTVQDKLAQAMGYLMGTGAMVLYAPILLKILKKGDAEGFAVSTWIFNVLGFALSIAYPFKRGFPISTYLEVVASAVQAVVILGLICFHQKQLFEYTIGMVGLFVGFLVFAQMPVPGSILAVLQITASLVANYANVPQILLTFRRKKASWSGVTAFLSMSGCLIRVFTTMQLTHDNLVIMGYLLGFLTNGILLGQVIMYRNNK